MNRLSKKHLPIVATILAVIAIHVVGRVGSYCSPLQNDSYIYASFGYRIAQGDVLYRDMSDIKPPGLFLLFALGYKWLPASRASVVPIESLFLLLAYYAVYLLTRDIFGRLPGLITTVVATIVINYFTMMGHVIEGFGLAENFMILPATAGMIYYRRSLHHPPQARRSLLIAGLFFGLATMLKQSAVSVIAAAVIHWTCSTVFRNKHRPTWLTGAALLCLGGIVAWSPCVVLMLAQGTLAEAFQLLTIDAGAMVTKGTAWPLDYAEWLPMRWPMLLCLWSTLAALEKWKRGVSTQNFPSIDSSDYAVPSDTKPINHQNIAGMENLASAIPIVKQTDLWLVICWCATELALLRVMPLRSAHYYVTACVPFIILSGWPWSTLIALTSPFAKRVAFAVICTAITTHIALLAAPLNTMIPTTIARFRAYDWKSDQQAFDDAIGWGRIHFGRGQPWTD